MTTAAEMLTAIDAAILARVQGTSVESAGQNGAQLKTMTLDELRLLRKEYERIETQPAAGSRKIRRTLVNYADPTT